MHASLRWCSCSAHNLIQALPCSSHPSWNLQYAMNSGKEKRTGGERGGERVDAVCDDQACDKNRFSSPFFLKEVYPPRARSRFLIGSSRWNPRVSYRRCRTATWAGLLLRSTRQRFVTRMYPFPACAVPSLLLLLPPFPSRAGASGYSPTLTGNFLPRRDIVSDVVCRWMGLR